jgi:hypothetical protein
MPPEYLRAPRVSLSPLAEVGFITLEGPQRRRAAKNALFMTVLSFVAKYQPIAPLWENFL